MPYAGVRARGQRPGGPAPDVAADGSLDFSRAAPLTRWQQLYVEAAHGAGRSDFEIAPQLGAIEAAATEALAGGVDAALLEAAVRLNAETGKPARRLHIEVAAVRDARHTPAPVVSPGEQLAEWRRQHPGEAAELDARCAEAERRGQERLAHLRQHGVEPPRVVTA